MQWLCAVSPLRQNRQAVTAPAQGCMIGDGDIDREYVGDRSQQALGLTQRLMEYQAESKARRDGQWRIDRLTAPLSGSRRLPCRHGLLGEPTPSDFRALPAPHRIPASSSPDIWPWVSCGGGFR